MSRFGTGAALSHDACDVPAAARADGCSSRSTAKPIRILRLARREGDHPQQAILNATRPAKSRTREFRASLCEGGNPPLPPPTHPSASLQAGRRQSEAVEPILQPSPAPGSNRHPHPTRACFSKDPVDVSYTAREHAPRRLSSTRISAWRRMRASSRGRSRSQPEPKAPKT